MKSDSRLGTCLRNISYVHRQDELYRGIEQHRERETCSRLLDKMSKALNSPTARLFQSSRLFSLPRPLPQAQLEGVTSTGLYRASDTATLPYPTHQAIATPASSLSRGDWGLKRPLPTKTTHHTSTPHIRVNAQDTSQHITDFASAADHTQTAAKWAEMGIPMVKRPEKKTTGGYERGESVYESWLDNTDPHALAVKAQARDQKRDLRRIRRDLVPQEATPTPKQRWKYTGPWIGGMQEGEVEQFLARKIEGRQGEWREFLRRFIVDENIERKRREGRDKGNPLSDRDIEMLKPRITPTDAHLTRFEKKLRDDHVQPGAGLSSDLTSLLTKFLDLPTIPVPNHDEGTAFRDPLLNRLTSEKLLAEDGPPSTHPGAGLSYLRTNAIMDNHPLHGPQKHRTPVEARVVRPRNGVGAQERLAKLGVGGVVADDSLSATMRGGKQDDEADRMANQMDADVLGGNRLWVQPETAHVNEKGSIRLSVTRADPVAVAVKKGEVEHIHEQKRQTRDQQMSGLPMPGGRNFAAMPVGVSNYAGRSPAAPRSRMQGFDDTIERRSRGGDIDRQSAANWIRNLGRDTQS